MISRHASRRAFLRGIGGAMLALPIFDYMLNDNGTALATGEPLPKFFGTYFWGAGMSPTFWFPTGSGPSYTIASNSPLSPFQTRGVKNFLNVAKNFTTYSTDEAGGDGHYPWAAIGLTGLQRDRSNNMYRGKTIDYIVRDALYPSMQGQRILDLHLSTSATPMISDPTLAGTRSFNGSQINQPTFRPLDAYNRIFGGVTIDPESPESHKARRHQSVLDAVKDDAGVFRAKLGSADRARFDAHLGSIEAIRNSLDQQVIPVTCTKPPAPTGPFANPTPRYQVIDEPAAEINDLMCDVLIAGINCGLVPVFSYSHSGASGGSYHNIPSVQALGPTTYGAPIAGYHGDLAHQDLSKFANAPSVAAIDAAFNDCNRTIIDHLAVLAQKMNNVQMAGGGTMLERSLLFATSEHAEAHSPNNMPILLVGGAGGAMKTPGIMKVGANETRTSVYEQIAAGRNSVDILATICRAMGTPAMTLGEGENTATLNDAVTDFLSPGV